MVSLKNNKKKFIKSKVKKEDCLKKCNYYIESQHYCIGTKECEDCTCKGDRIKCDFYSEIRDKAKIEIEEKLKSLDPAFYFYYIIKKDIFLDIINEYNNWLKNN